MEEIADLWMEANKRCGDTLSREAIKKSIEDLSDTSLQNIITAVHEALKERDKEENKK